MKHSELRTSWAISPLAPDGSNAFNPPFVLNALLVLFATTAVTGIPELWRMSRQERFGPISPKNTGFFHIIRCALVILHTALWTLLAAASGRNSSAFFPVSTITAATFLILLPIQVIETSVLPMPAGVVLAFWPAMSVMNAIFYFQNHHTHLPLIIDSSQSVGVFTFGVGIAIAIMETLRRFWKPSHKLILAYSNDPILTLRLKDPHLIERLTFSWMNPLITNSYKLQTIDVNALPPAPPDLLVQKFTAKVEKYWNKPNAKRSKVYLILCLIRSFGPLAAYAFLLEAFDSVISFINPQLLRLLIRFIDSQSSDQPEPMLKGFLISFSMFFVTMVLVALINKYNLQILEVGLSTRTSLASLIYKKSLVLSALARSKRALGDMVNLSSIDAVRVQGCAQSLENFVTAPIELTICLWSLYGLLGKSAFFGLFVLVGVIPLNWVIVRYSKTLNKEQMKVKDERNRITTEILLAMKSLKLYSWEMPLLKRLLYVRNEQELRNMRKLRFINSVYTTIWTTVPFMISLVVFAHYAWTHEEPLTADVVFPALALMNILQSPLTMIPSTISQAVEAQVALDRISLFLLEDEIEHDLLVKDLSDDAVKLEQISFLWNKPAVDTSEESEFTNFRYALKNINITAEKGQLVCVVGKVGSGKTSLLSSIMGHLEPMHTEKPYEKPSPIVVNGSIAYCSQNPWILNASVRDNILFGYEYDEKYYNQTIEACQLLYDLKILPDGDHTQVGEKGISLSGGQKARLSLARALYARADIYLLDDILSAVDNHVGKAIIEKVLSRSGMLGSTTVILATNNVAILPFSDKVYLLANGEIVEETTFDEATTEEHPLFVELLTEFGYSNQGEGLKSVELPPINSLPPPPEAVVAPFTWDPFGDSLKSARTGQRAESRSKGKVKWSHYMEYARACSLSGLSVWFVIAVLSAFAGVYQKYWLKHWSELNGENGLNGDVLRFVRVFSSIGLFTILLNFLKNVIFKAHLGIRAGAVIHDNMANRVIRAPMSFFERTPTGRIINRFSSDINKIDDQLAISVMQLAVNVISACMTFAVVCSAIPVFTGVVIVLGFFYSYYQKYYVAIQRELKRLVSISRSPIFAHLGESLAGVDTIRAFGQQERFTMTNDANINFNMRSLFMLRSVNRWLSVRLLTLGNMVIWISSTMLILQLRYGLVTGGTVGFVMSYALTVKSNLQWVIRVSAEVESNVVCVERCVEYCHLPQEEDENGNFVEPSPHWPSQGAIALEHYSTRYAKNLDLVLKDVNVAIRPGEKVGIVGRTGAGKSTFVLAVFRMLPAAEGRIVVDDLDTTKLRLFNLRHRLSIIPQDSHLFEGSIRQNLDPFTEYSDEELWKVLDLSCLKDFVMSLPGSHGLESKVSEGGSNFSSGQRQLMCLGRALLNPSKILLLDEATAAVDIQTDKLIQRTIRAEFKHKTIVTIAHRLDTVMDSDRILALDLGEVKEFDTPENLLNDPNSVFYKLCKNGQQRSDTDFSDLGLENDA